ncbi:MAG: hypothetical protein ACTSYW_01520 [Candidatus Heimdallarchaeota archaeon]
MESRNIDMGFLVTKTRLTSDGGQMDQIKSYNAKYRDRIIIPLQGPHIQEFFILNKSTKEFLDEMIKLSKYKIKSLRIEK